MKQISGVDEEGFYLLLTYETKDPEDTEAMLSVLYNPEVDSKVKGYDDDHVEVIVRLDLEVLLRRTPDISPAIDRHARQHPHADEGADYLSSFLNDDDMTLAGRPSVHCHEENPIGMGKVPLRTSITLSAMNYKGSLKAERHSAVGVEIMR
jgi:hypothetical protein